MFQVNPSAFDSVFVLPSKVVDRHIRLAGSVQLKVLLWFYRHASNTPNIDILVEFIGLPKADVIDAITYWLDCGLLIESKALKKGLPNISIASENENEDENENKYENENEDGNKNEDENKNISKIENNIKKEEIQTREESQTREKSPQKKDLEKEIAGIKKEDTEKSDTEKSDTEKSDTEKSDTERTDTKKADKEKGEKDKKEEKPQKKAALPDIPLIKPNMQQVAARLEESSELRMFFAEAQNILGRTLGFDAQVSLLMLHDHYGLPPSVILMICEYARSHNKQNSMTYILKLGKAWAEQEIDTFEKATEQLSRLEGANIMWSKFKVMAGIATPKPTMRQQEYLSVWVNDWDFSVDMIFAAYEEMAEKTGGLSFSYIDKILQNWHKSDAKTLDDVENIKAERSAKFKTAKTGGSKQKKASSSKNSKSGDASYDLDEAERKANYEPIVYKKKGD